MQLTKLELHGFKSFADPTEMLFDSGVTAIVGPNGCGKSNVSDAVRWVLGEQRARVMRGAKMEEVIFQGSSARRAVGLAEVSLHFSNDDGGLPVPFKEVVLTRRLTRAGDSEYFLNRAPCRLRDIHDLVRGTGLGADSGVVIESKMIDALLSDRPDDRRELFEEAAGVGLYRDRRRATERSLEQTSADLARLDDLINEVTSQVRSLSRQRKRAERHAEITTRRFAVDLTLASREMAAWHEELGELDGRLGALRADAPAAQVRVGEAEQLRDAAHAARAAADTARSARALAAAEAREAALTLQGEIAVAEERHRNALDRRQRAEAERSEGAALGERVVAEWDAARVDEEQTTVALREAAEALQRHVGAEEDARGGVAAAREALERADRHVRELRDAMRRIELEREGAERELAAVAQQSDSLAAEHEQLAAQQRLAERELAAADEALALAKGAAAEADAAAHDARETAKEWRDNDAIARADVRRIDEEHAAVQGKLSALEGLERERVGLAPAAARLLRDRDQFGEGAVLGPLSDFIGADAATALLVERFLGPTVHAVVVRDRATADAVRHWHATANPGALLLLPLDALQDLQDGAEAGELASQVQTEGPVRSWVRSLLGHVRSIDDGSAFIDARGAVWLPGTQSGAGPLRRRAELFELRSAVAASEATRAQAAATLQVVHENFVKAEAAAAAASDAATAAHQRVQQSAAVRADRERTHQRATRELADAVALSERLSGRRAELGAKITECITAIERESAALTAAEQAVSGTREALADADRRQDAAREARAAAQVAHAQAQARREVAAERRVRLERERDSATARLETLQRELFALAEDDAVLERQMLGWRDELAGRQQTLQGAESALAESEAAVRAADAALTGADHALDAIRREAVAAADALHHAELRHTELSGKRGAIKERLETEWRRPLDDLLANYVPVELDDDALAAEAEQLRSQLEALGPVNPLAIEEHEEEVKRLDFLQGQRNDLAQAQQSLQQAIREIDVTAREMFLKTFEEVRNHFRHIFLTLFGGGECDLRLENPEAPLDCDIEIHASPRGKKTQRIHLLSSGERALVALSLLFGIFLTKPSPFCLLDEVDAPLDDQNIGRFVRMLNQFKANTQFIVITHNPRTTTEAADAVYGVTMQEPGVSSLVSVRMRGPAVDATAAPAAAV
ncbi:MAG: chromosome segregation protein SMC [Gemmatimonadetes bacterium]|nr:chromosome segregation protein SMC [Gemmatimonadota bacterium]MBI3568438.1 chromosome segregation protein SMC [Gemmatimonadota bacterium]